jgi:hypothetical protein
MEAHTVTERVGVLMHDWAPPEWLSADWINHNMVHLRPFPVLVCTFQRGKRYATAILWKDGDQVVQNYRTRAKACTGHRGWVDNARVARLILAHPA